MTELPTQGVLPTRRQLAYVRYLLSQAHRTGLPYVPVWAFSRADVEAWIEYLQGLLDAQRAVEAALDEARRTTGSAGAYLRTPARECLPAGYRPPWQELPCADDHEHLVGSVTREDGVQESVCVLCGTSG